MATVLAESGPVEGTCAEELRNALEDVAPAGHLVHSRSTGELEEVLRWRIVDTRGCRINHRGIHNGEQCINRGEGFDVLPAHMQATPQEIWEMGQALFYESQGLFLPATFLSSILWGLSGAAEMAEILAPGSLDKNGLRTSMRTVRPVGKSVIPNDRPMNGRHDGLVLFLRRAG